MIDMVTYAGRPNNYRLTDGRLEAIVATDIGPRVLRLGFVGGRNEFAELDASQPTPYGEWRIYGGPRLWHSPEAMPRSYYPDNDPCTVDVDEDSVTVVQPTEPPTGVQKTMRLTMGEGYIEVDHILTNEGLWPVEAAPWALSVMAPGGTAILQAAKERDPDNLLPNRSLILWPYTDLTDPRLVLGRDLILLHQRTDAAGPIKLGVNNDSGWAAYYNQNHLFIKRFAVDIFAVYPDNGCTVECYTNAQMLELESLGSLVLLEPGESAYHTERWYLFEAPGLPLGAEVALLEAVNSHLSRTGEPG
jgi:hypothetical protein